MKIKSTALFIILALALMACVSSPQLLLLAGSLGGSGFVDGRGSDARFLSPNAVVIAANGDLVVLDSGNNALRRITPQGDVTTLASSASWEGNDSGLGRDSLGNFYMASTYSHTIYKIAADGTVNQIAGLTGSGGNADGGGSSARFDQPRGIAVGSDDTVYVADSNNSVIRKISPATHEVSTLRDASNAPVIVDGVARIAIAPDGTLYAIGTQPCVIRISTDGVVTVLAGSTNQGSADGIGEEAMFNYLRGIALDPAGNILVSDAGNATIRKITQAGVVSTVAGTSGAEGSQDGSTGSAARFSQPTGLAVTASGTIYVTDLENATLRKITPAGKVTTLAGLSNKQFLPADGELGQSWLRTPVGLAVSGSNLLVWDRDTFSLRRISASGSISTVAGKTGMPGADDGTGEDARFNYGSDIALDADGNAYVSDSSNHAIRKITPEGVVTTFAGALPDSFGFQDGPLAAARFARPAGLAFDAAGNLWVADAGNNAIRKITPEGIVSTEAGGNGGGSQNGPAHLASFGELQGLAVDAAGNVYVADSDNHLVRRLSPAGIVSTVAGIASVAGEVNGLAASATFNFPQGIAIGTGGSLLVADNGNHAVRRISSTGVVSTVVGDPARQVLKPGALAKAGLGAPRRLVLLPDGQLAITTQNAVVVTQGAHF